MSNSQFQSNISIYVIELLVFDFDQWVKTFEGDYNLE